MATSLEDRIYEPLTDQECYLAALSWTNDFLAEYGKEPLEALPRGTADHPNRCALAMALQHVGDTSAPFPPSARYGGHSGATFCYKGDVITRPAPRAVREFMVRFDAGLYPELIA